MKKTLFFLIVLSTYYDTVKRINFGSMSFFVKKTNIFHLHISEAILNRPKGQSKEKKVKSLAEGKTNSSAQELVRKQSKDKANVNNNLKSLF